MEREAGNLIMVLHKVQEEFGYISRDSADKVAELLDIPLATIYGVVTFITSLKQRSQESTTYKSVLEQPVI